MHACYSATNNKGNACMLQRHNRVQIPLVTPSGGASMDDTVMSRAFDSKRFALKMYFSFTSGAVSSRVTTTPAKQFVSKV